MPNKQTKSLKMPVNSSIIPRNHLLHSFLNIQIYAEGLLKQMELTYNDNAILNNSDHTVNPEQFYHNKLHNQKYSTIYIKV